MTSAVLYGTTSDNILKPVRVTDSGEFVTDGGGSSDWYANLYVGGTQGNPSISLLSDGSIEAAGVIQVTTANSPVFQGFNVGTVTATVSLAANGSARFGSLTCDGGATDGNITAVGDVYANKFIPADGYDVSKIGQALSTIHDVIESVDDLEGLKNLFHLLLDNLKTDPIPPTP